MAKVEFATRTRAPFPAPAPRWAGGGPRPRPEAGNRALAEEGENGRGQTVTTGRWPKSSGKYPQSGMRAKARRVWSHWAPAIPPPVRRSDGIDAVLIDDN